MLYVGVDLGTSSVKLLLMDQKHCHEGVSAVLPEAWLVGAEAGGLVGAVCVGNEGAARRI